MKVLLLGLVFLVASLAQTTGDADNLPFCDEINDTTNPADGGSGVVSSTSGLNNTATDSDTIPNAEQLASEINNLIDELTNGGSGGAGGAGGAAAAQQAFSSATTAQLILLGEVTLTMSSKQAEINDLVANVLPSFENLLDSRRKRSLVLRSQIKAMNNKLQALVDSLDRSAYVQEQQKFLSVIDALMRLQNTVEMSALGSSSTFSVRPTESHPAANALLSVAQETTHTVSSAVSEAKAAAADDSTVLEMLHALDLLELESRELPYNRRVSLLAKKIVSIIGRLVDMFNELRVKHKTYAKDSRVLWGQQLDTMQEQADEFSTNLESVMDQAHYYLNAYAQNKARLSTLITEQKHLHQRYFLLQDRIARIGKDYNATATLRASQMRKLAELSHYLTYGNAPFTESVFDFACDGVVGGSARVDFCGVCGGHNETCMDCAGTVNGRAVMDVCGVCGGEGKSCQYFCDGIPNSGNITDLCGTCGGNSTLCTGCDGIPRSGLVLDACGMCGGDGSACAANDTSLPQNTQSSTTVIVKLELNTTFTVDWSSKYGVPLRSAVAAVVSATPSQVQIMSIGGHDTVVVNLSILVDATAGGTTADMLSASVRQGSLRIALSAQNIANNGVVILDGPSVLSS